MKNILLIFIILVSCNNKEINRHCKCDSKVDYSFKDHDYKYNNWDRRNSSFNMGFYFSSDSTYYYLKSSLKRKDTVYFINESKISNDELIINKVLLNDKITILDTLYFPIKVKFRGSGLIYNNTIISPDQSKILFIYTDYPDTDDPKSAEKIKTLFILYDVNKWEKIYEITYPSEGKTNAFAWSPDGDKILFYNLEKGDIILFNIKNKSFDIITKEKEHSVTNLKWGNDNRKFYYIRKHKFLIEYDMVEKKKSILYKTRNSLWAIRDINNFFILDNDDIYVEWVDEAKFLPYMLAIEHHDCMLKNCIKNTSIDNKNSD